MPASRKRTTTTTTTTSCGTSIVSPSSNVNVEEQSENGDLSPPLEKKFKQQLPCLDSNTTHQKQEMISNELFQTHLQVAKEFITSCFGSIDGMAQEYGRTKYLWTCLNGTQWQDDPDIAVAALQVGLPPDPFLRGRSIFKDSEKLITAFYATKHEWQARELWDLVQDPKLKEYPPLALAAWERGVSTNKINMKVIDDGDQWLELIKDGTVCWESLPEKFKSDVEFALASREQWVTDDVDFATALEVVTDTERLFREWACVYPEELQYDGTYLWGQAPEQIMSDRKLMKDALPISPYAFEYISQSLMDDETFLQEVVKENMLLLGLFSEDIFVKFPNFLTIAWIRGYWDAGGDDYLFRSYKMKCHLCDCIPINRWKDRDFVLNTWFAAGGHMHEHLDRSYYDDEDLILKQAKHFYSHPLRQSINDYCIDPQYPRRLSPRLKANKAFLRSLIEVSIPEHVIELFERYRVGLNDDRPRETNSDDSDDEIPFEPSPLHHDEELVILLFSKRHSTYSMLMDCWWPTLKRKVEEYERFFHGILCGMHSGSGSLLSMLDQGRDSNIIKKTIASFLDFPIGKSLQELMQVKEHFGIKKELLFNGSEIPPKHVYVTTDPSSFYSDYDYDIASQKQNPSWEVTEPKKNLSRDCNKAWKMWPFVLEASTKLPAADDSKVTAISACIATEKAPK
ncbi:protein of unknown function DUF4116 containing protein [Nitzschia inconspicua]|uniref:Uncharacterized protein n=1 Tax=Nitzschia inconspicua TaxID=303405 RepID=A0A9K3KIV2_9STRA|nr:protein of unknown function DUF4116 containing protein [Nitzschia inconspicua]